MKFTYTKGWFRAHKRPLALWDVEDARREHEAGRMYTVLLGDFLEHPIAFLEVHLAKGFIGVNVLDEHLRAHLEYKFVRKDERFFLQQTAQRTYEGANEKVIRLETMNFTPEGQLTIYDNDVVSGETTVKTATLPVDVSRHWEDAPAFGQYSGFVRWER